MPPVPVVQPPWGLLADGSFRFEMGLRRGSEEFFRNAPDDNLLRGRRRWLADEPENYAAALPEGGTILNEAADWARSLNIESASTSIDVFAKCLDLGGAWEPDFLLLRPEAGGEPWLVAGCVCFPSGWSLTEKLGCPISAIHAPVPTLNQSLGRQIGTFIERLRPGDIWERSNWGLAASPDLNAHPARHLPRLEPGARIDAAWFRLERQAFLRLPKTGAILFGIRVSTHLLAEVAAFPAAALRLASLLATMPADIARYKGVESSRAGLIGQLS